MKLSQTIVNQCADINRRKCKVFQAEIIVIMKAARLIKIMQNEITEPVTINSDTVLRCCVVLENLRLYRPPGLSKIEENEKTDEIKRIGLAVTNLEVADILKTPFCHFTRGLKLFFKKKRITRQSIENKFGPIWLCLEDSLY